MQEDTEVLIVGSTTIKKEMKAYNELKKLGFKIIDEYIHNIEEIYGLADCYVFPTFSENYCVEMPLSVMEAMSCNLPVITTRFRALPRIFEEGDGLFFVDNEDEIFEKIEELKSNDKLKVETRKKVLKYSWTNVVNQLTAIYSRVNDESQN